MSVSYFYENDFKPDIKTASIKLFNSQLMSFDCDAKKQTRWVTGQNITALSSHARKQNNLKFRRINKLVENYF